MQELQRHLEEVLILNTFVFLSWTVFDLKLEIHLRSFIYFVFLDKCYKDMLIERNVYKYLRCCIVFSSNFFRRFIIHGNFNFINGRSFSWAAGFHSRISSLSELFMNYVIPKLFNVKVFFTFSSLLLCSVRSQKVKLKRCLDKPFRETLSWICFVSHIT